MPFKCCVPGCRANRSGGPKASMFTFPRDEGRRSRWVKALPRRTHPLTCYSRVCELHFLECFIVRKSVYDDLRTGRKIEVALPAPRLHPNAVPTVFEDCPEWPSEQSVSDGPEKKKIKQEPHYDEEVSWDTNDSIDDRVDGESLSSNQAQAQQHRAEATLENTADTSMASTSASPTAGSQQDAFHFFGMMVADRLRRLPRGAALRALNAMHQVLFEHEEEAGF
ncbi:uncharacterized protein [Dermacentor albipictus]|uniref:uncharacterized protein isoform X8 n=1 Tax=Dermacentor albipictus TaxID=60249 RepID=UPI0038FC3EFB